jgi:hypothetical protein
MMIKNYITNEIREHIKRLVEHGKIGNSSYFQGISVSDESHLTSLLLQAIPSHELPHLSSLDTHNGLTTLIARFIDKNDDYSGNQLAVYIGHLYVDFFKETIRDLIEDVLNESQSV